MKYSKGIMWLDDCRIPHSEEIMIATDYKETKQSENGWNTKNRILEPSNRGRFTPNLLVCDDMLNDGSVSKSVKNKTNGDVRKSTIVGAEKSSGFYRPDYFVNRNNFDDKGSNSRFYDLDKWFDKVIDEIQ